MSQQRTENPSPRPPLDAAGARRAHIRAIAAGLVDGPRMSRRFDVPAGVPLERSPRHRSHAPRRRSPAVERDRRPVVRRLLAVGFLVVQVGLLAAFLNAPMFRVHAIEVSGDRLVGRAAVLAAARVPHSSLFTLDGDAIRARVSALPWVRSAVVTTQLPSTVSIEVTEWQPDLLLRHGAVNTFVAADGATLPFTSATAAARQGIPVLLDYRPGAQHALPPGLADLLASAAQRWQPVFGCTVDAFVISNSGVLSAWSSTGWQAVFGTLDSSDAVAAIPGQLAVLAALSGRVDFTHPAFGYVDLENPATPAVGGHAGEPASLRADLAAAALPASSAPAVAQPAPPPSPPPSATPSPSPTPTPSPTPRPSPSPLVFSLAPAPTP